MLITHQLALVSQRLPFWSHPGVTPRLKSHGFTLCSLGLSKHTEAVMRLTKRAVEALENKDIHYEVRDDAQKGFVVRVGETGNKAFYRVYRTGKGRRAPLKRLHIGSFPRMSIEQARNIAKEKAALVVMGDDPARMVQDEKSTPFVKDIIVF